MWARKLTSWAARPSATGAERVHPGLADAAHRRRRGQRLDLAQRVVEPGAQPRRLVGVQRHRGDDGRVAVGDLDAPPRRRARRRRPAPGGRRRRRGPATTAPATGEAPNGPPPASEIVMSRWVWLSATGTASGGGWRRELAGTPPAPRLLVVHQKFIFPTPGTPRVGRVTVTDHVARLSVAVDGTTYPAEEIGRGAAYEIFSVAEATGFERDPRPETPYPFHRWRYARRRDPVETMTRRTEYAMWRDCLVLGQESGWLRLRLCRPDADAVAASARSATSGRCTRPGRRWVRWPTAATSTSRTSSSLPAGPAPRPRWTDRAC